MATITLKGIPPRLHRALKRRAEHHRRSLNQEVLFILEKSIEMNKRDVDLILEEARKCANR